MNREIKFRVWDIELHMWINNIGMGKNNTLCKGTEKRFAVMQYIGLKDKDGNEVYEGDILKETEFDEEGNDISGYYPVVYAPKTCQFCIDNSFKKDGSHLVNIIAYFGIDNIEVVGNIYETPELLPCGSIYGCH